MSSMIRVMITALRASSVAVATQEMISMASIAGHDSMRALRLLMVSDARSASNRAISVVTSMLW